MLNIPTTFQGRATRFSSATTPRPATIAPAPLPTIRVVQVPKFGTLTVRRGILSTDAIAGCAGLKIPTQVVFYEVRTGHLGSDHVAYQVTAYSGGVVGIFDMTFDVKEPPKDGGPANEPKN